MAPSSGASCAPHSSHRCGTTVAVDMPRILRVWQGPELTCWPREAPPAPMAVSAVAAGAAPAAHDQLPGERPAKCAMCHNERGGAVGDDPLEPFRRCHGPRRFLPAPVGAAEDPIAPRQVNHQRPSPERQSRRPARDSERRFAKQLRHSYGSPPGQHFGRCDGAEKIAADDVRRAGRKAEQARRRLPTRLDASHVVRIPPCLETGPIDRPTGVNVSGGAVPNEIDARHHRRRRARSVFLADRVHGKLDQRGV